MSAIFQRPLCEMGAAYEYAFRAEAGDPTPGFGGPCDDRPHAVAVRGTGPTAAVLRSFSLCPEHESQLRQVDASLVARGSSGHFSAAPGARR